MKQFPKICLDKTFPKGTVLIECGKLLQRAKYQIKVFNTINFAKSMHYNPFAYIHSEKDVLKLVNTLIANTKGEGKSGDDFWVKAETLLYTALISYIMLKAPNKEKNFFTLIKMISAMETREDDEDYKNHVDQMFDELEKEDPNHFAVRQYRKFKLAAGGAALGILLAAQAFISGSIGLANVIFMILLSADFFLPMRRLGSYFHVAMNGMGASDKIFKFLGEKEPKEKKETGTVNSYAQICQQTQ